MPCCARRLPKRYAGTKFSEEWLTFVLAPALWALKLSLYECCQLRREFTGQRLPTAPARKSGFRNAVNWAVNWIWVVRASARISVLVHEHERQSSWMSLRTRARGSPQRCQFISTNDPGKRPETKGGVVPIQGCQKAQRAKISMIWNVNFRNDIWIRFLIQATPQTNLLKV